MPLFQTACFSIFQYSCHAYDNVIKRKFIPIGHVSFQYFSRFYVTYHTIITGYFFPTKEKSMIAVLYYIISEKHNTMNVVGRCFVFQSQVRSLASVLCRLHRAEINILRKDDYFSHLKLICSFELTNLMLKVH